MIYSPKLFLVAVGLPLASLFGVVPPGTGEDSVSLGVEQASSGGLNGQWTPTSPQRRDENGNLVLTEFPTDVCSDLGKYKPITEKNEHCGSKKTPEDCEPDKIGMTLKEANGKMTTLGKAVVYDICLWNYEWKNKKGVNPVNPDTGVTGMCRLASESYSCLVTCDGVPSDRAFRSNSDDAKVELVLKEDKKVVKLPSGKWGKITIKTPALTLGKRQLEVEESEVGPDTRRKLSGPKCDNVDYTDENGVQRTCCVGITNLGGSYFNDVAQNIVNGRETTDLVVQDLTQNLVTCTQEGTSCECGEIEQEVVAGGAAACPASVEPFVWGSSGFKKTGATALRHGDTHSEVSFKG